IEVGLVDPAGQFGALQRFRRAVVQREVPFETVLGAQHFQGFTPSACVGTKHIEAGKINGLHKTSYLKAVSTKLRNLRECSRAGGMSRRRSMARRPICRCRATWVR